MTDNEDSDNSYEVGDEKTVSALSLPREIAKDVHELELNDAPASIGIGLKWKCERCGRFYADWKVFESEPCIPWKIRTGGPEEDTQ